MVADYNLSDGITYMAWLTRLGDESGPPGLVFGLHSLYHTYHEEEMWLLTIVGHIHGQNREFQTPCPSEDSSLQLRLHLRPRTEKDLYLRS